MDRKLYVAKIIKNINQKWKLIRFDSQVWISRDAWKVESRKIEKGEREREEGKIVIFLKEISRKDSRQRNISLQTLFLEIISSFLFPQWVVFPVVFTMWEIEEDPINRKAKFRVEGDRWTSANVCRNDRMEINVRDLHLLARDQG